jgi:hypothetical protein
VRWGGWDGYGRERMEGREGRKRKGVSCEARRMEREERKGERVRLWRKRNQILSGEVSESEERRGTPHHPKHNPSPGRPYSLR